MRLTNLTKKLTGIAIVILVMSVSRSAFAFAYQDRVSTAKSLAHYAMGQVYEYLGLTKRSVLEYEKAIQFDQGSYLLHLRLGAGYARLDLYENAIQHLKLVQQFNSEDLQSHYLLALIYSNLKEYDLAATEYEHILKTFADNEPKNIEVYSYLGQLYYSQKKFKQAIAQYEKILELEPKNADVMYVLGTLYWEADVLEKAYVVLSRALEVDPDHDGVLNTLAYFYAESGQNLDEALKLVKRALVISPENGGYLDSLGWVYYKMGKYEEALEAFIRADEYIKDPVIYDHMGDTYFKLNQPENAVKFWKYSLILLPDQKNVVEKIESVTNSQASLDETE